MGFVSLKNRVFLAISIVLFSYVGMSWLVIGFQHQHRSRFRSVEAREFHQESVEEIDPEVPPRPPHAKFQIQDYTGMNETQYKKEILVFRNLPLELYSPETTVKKAANWIKLKCARFPKFHELQIQNIHWQDLKVGGETFILLSASYDNRPEEGAYVRIILGARMANVLPDVKCRLWFEKEDKPVIVDHVHSRYIHQADSNATHAHKQFYFAHLLNCPIPEIFRKTPPIAVSLHDSECDPSTNVLRVRNSEPVQKARKGFGICAKALFYPFQDYSIRLTEWLEMVLALGARKVHIYVLSIEENVRLVLEYYKKRGLIEVLPITWPGDLPTDSTPWIQAKYFTDIKWLKPTLDQFVFNDCFNNNIYEYEYITLLDWDELIMPTKSLSWENMFNDIEATYGKPAREIDTFFFHHYFFFENSTHEDVDFSDPSTNRILETDLRTTNNLGGWQLKAFFNTRTVRIVFNHEDEGCVSGGCENRVMIDPGIGRLNHYRAECGKIHLFREISCEIFTSNLTLDNRVDFFRPQVLQGIERVKEFITKSKELK